MFRRVQIMTVLIGGAVAFLSPRFAHAQPIALPPAPFGVETFTSSGIQFSRVRAQNVTPYPANGRGNYLEPIGGGNWDFGMARTELTQGQWVEFLGAFQNVPVPDNQPWTRTLNEMFVQSGAGVGVYFTEVGTLGRPVYQTTPEGGLIPCSRMGWYGAAAYCNWLQNGRQASIEAITNGAYDLRGWSNEDAHTWPGVTRSVDARYFIPTYNEWAVASFYDQNRFGPGEAGWWPYLNGRDRLPITGVPGVGETAAGLEGEGGFSAGLFQPIASYPDAQSPWGLLDTSGTTFEFVQDSYGSENFGRLLAGTRAGPFLLPELEWLPEVPGWVSGDIPISNYGYPWYGVRLAVTIPGPSGVALAAVCLLTAFRRNRKC